MALIAIQRNIRDQGKKEFKNLGAKIDDWFKKQFDKAEKANNARPGGKLANFQLGVAEGVYGGVKGIGEGLVFLNDQKDKAIDARVDAITHPAETYQSVKKAAVATKDAVSKAPDG